MDPWFFPLLSYCHENFFDSGDIIERCNWIRKQIALVFARRFEELQKTNYGKADLDGKKNIPIPPGVIKRSNSYNSH